MNLYRDYIDACLNGQLEVVKLLVDSCPSSIYGFQCACRNGHLEVAKLLVQIRPSVGTISSCDNAFRVVRILNAGFNDKKNIHPFTN